MTFVNRFFCFLASRISYPLELSVDIINLLV